jgi:hypothetical protein
MLRENAAWDPMLVPPEFFEGSKRDHQRLMASRPSRRTVRFRPLGLTRLTWRRPYLDDGDREFADAMQRAYERLRADPIAWREYMEELASIDPAFAELIDAR